MACERAKHGSCSVFGCTNEHKSQFSVPSSEPLKNQWVDFIFSGKDARVCAKHFTDDCFLNLGQYRAGLAQRLNIKSGSVPTLLGSATNLGQASTSSAYIQQLLSRDVACQTDHQETPTVGTQLSLKTLRLHFKSEEDLDAFGDRSTQRGATSESLGVDAPGSSHMASQSKELKILSVHGKGEGPLAVDGLDTIFTASEVEALNSLSADHSVDRSLERGERLVCHEELSVQLTPDTISIKVEEDIGGGMPAVENCDAFGDRSTQRGATSESLGGDAPGSSHISSSSKELKILSVHGKGEGPLAQDGHDTLFTVSEVEALNSLSADHSVAMSLERGERLVCREELRVQLTPDTISIKVEKDIGGGMPTVEPEALSSLSVDHSVAKSMNCSVRLVHLEELTYRCDQCMKRFSQKAYLKQHMRTHSGEKPYKCDQCMMSFGKSSRLKVHMMTHTGEKPYRCDQCKMCFNRRYTLKTHIRTHTGEKPYKCDQCTKSFGKSFKLKIHMMTHTGEMPYKCDQCRKSFSQNSLLKSHMMTHTGEMPYKCDQCKMCFSQRCSLKIHIRTHTGEEPYKCDQCKKNFATSSSLKIHMMIHTGEKPYKCDQCTKCFNRKDKLNIHMMSHSGEIPYKCDHCMKCFGKSTRLKIHMRTHTGEKPYRCDQCMKSFRQSSGLKSHMMTHTGEKPYKCDQCRKSFSQRLSFKIHMRTHTGEQPYKCEQCTKNFGNSSKLKIHMMTHTGEKPYKCDQCMKGFSQSSALKSHMMTHTGEKPYRCDQCKMCFSQSGSLKIHIRIHTGEKPYKCDQCTKSFGRSSNLKTHMRTHSG